MTAAALSPIATESASVAIPETSRRRYIALKSRDALGSTSLAGAILLGAGTLPLLPFAFNFAGGPGALPLLETVYQLGIIPGFAVLGGVALYVKARNLIDRRVYGQYELEVDGEIVELIQVPESDGSSKLASAIPARAVAAS